MPPEDTLPLYWFPMASDRKTRVIVKQSESEAEAEMMGNIDRETFRTFVFDALSDEGIVRKFSEIMSPKFDQVTEKLDDALKYIDYLKTPNSRQGYQNIPASERC